MERAILHKALSYYFGTDCFSLMSKGDDYIIEKKDNKRYLLSEIDITEQYQQAEYEYQKIKNKERIEEIKNKLNELDIKKMRYFIEKEKGGLSGKKYFDEYEKETVLLRDQLKELEK